MRKSETCACSSKRGEAMGARRACKWSIQIRSKTSQVCDFLFYFTMSSCLIRFDRDRSIRLRDAESASRPHSGFWCLNDKIIKELMSFANECETERISCNYVEAIRSSRHMLWPIWLHILNVIKTRRISSKERQKEIHCHRLKAKLLKSRTCWDPQALTKMKERQKEESSWHLKFILKCFISFLSIGHRTIKSDAAWWS
jgi:hypothetical protein